MKQLFYLNHHFCSSIRCDECDEHSSPLNAKNCFQFGRLWWNKNALLVFLLIFLGFDGANAQKAATSANSASASARPATSIPTSIYDFKVIGLNGEIIDFGAFKGKKILIVNTTSRDGNNPQFAHLESVYQKYKDKLVIVGFPDDDFGEHPASNDETAYYKEVNYNVTFLMADKVGVKGDNRAPIYVWLTEKKYNNFMDSEVKWDFQKYLINEKGELVVEFDPKIKATGPRVATAIEN